MQNRYVGDLGDFGKYGLLRAFSRPLENAPALRLGVVWYLVPDESANADGSRIGYLSLPPNRAAAFRDCDPVLFDTMQRLVADGQRNVKSVSRASVLPEGTTFYERFLDFTDVPRNGAARRDFRSTWLRDACQLTAQCDLVFLDPDNGLGNSVAAHRKQGVKYAYINELKAFLEHGKAVIVYHHIGRQCEAREQIARQFSRFGLKDEDTAFALLYHRGTARSFFVIEPRGGNHRLLDRAMNMLSGAWSRHFELVWP